MNIISSYLMILLFCISYSAQAVNTIYKTTSNQMIYGNSNIQKVTVKGFMVLDIETYRLTALAGFTLNNLKLFSVVEGQNIRVDTIAGPKDSTYTLISKAESPGTQFAGVLHESIYMRGKNVPVTIDSQGVRAFPKTFITSSRSIVRNNETGIIVGSELSGTGVLDINGSRASNLSESHDDVVNRLTNYFIGRGYTKFTPEPAN